MPAGTRGGSLPKSDTKLAHWRLRRGVTQQDLARAIGIDVKVYRRIEKGDGVPPLDVLLNCAIALRVSLDDLVEDRWRTWQVLDQRASSPPDPDTLWDAGADRRHQVPPEKAVRLKPL